MSRSWTKDDTILALDAYLSGVKIRKSDPNFMELCELLGRSFGSVRMKFGNFNPLDPKYPGKGLSHIKKLDRQVWDEFYDNQARLRATASTIKRKKREAATAAEKIVADQNQESDRSQERDWANDWDNEELTTEAPEGKLLTQTHFRRERNPKLVRKKKESVLGETGQLACAACGFDFAKTYGERGEGFIECHHIKPLSDLKPGSVTRLKGLVLLCSNCHRMVHTKQPWLEVKDLKRLIGRAARGRLSNGNAPKRRRR